MKKNIRKLINIAAGRQPAELVLKNGTVANVFTGEFVKADVAISGGYIAGVGSYEGIEEVDCSGAYICPGFIDAHMHIESTMLMPGELVKSILPSGTTSIIADPHEIVNVSGAEGLDFLYKASEGLPCNIFFMLPSSVPSTIFETAGADFGVEDMKPFLKYERVLGLGELMAFPDVIRADDKVLEKIALFENMPVDGHSPGLRGKELQAYAVAGIKSEHESTVFSEALEKARAGMAVFVREGSAAHDLAHIVEGLISSNISRRRFMFCTDDKHIADIRRDGHIRWNVKLAIELGMKPIDAITMASLNTACHYKLKDIGAVAPGYKADIVLLESLEKVTVKKVYKDGREAEALIANIKPYDKTDGRVFNSVHINKVKEEDISLAVSGAANVIELVPFHLNTKWLVEELPSENGYFKGNEIYSKLCVFERHGKNGNIAVCALKGYGIKGGAVASTVAHDSHNIIAAGDNDGDIVIAVNRIKEIGGGYVIVRNGEVAGDLPLSVAGLISSGDADSVQQKTDFLLSIAKDMGIPYHIDPFTTLSFLALPVIPEIRLCDTGLFDVAAFKHIK